MKCAWCHTSCYHAFPRDYIGDLQEALHTGTEKTLFFHKVRPSSAQYMRPAALSHLIILWYLFHAGSDALPSTNLTCLNNGRGRLSRQDVAGAQPQELHCQANFIIPVWSSLDVVSDILAKNGKLKTNDKVHSICHQLNCGTWQRCSSSTRQKGRDLL